MRALLLVFALLNCTSSQASIYTDRKPFVSWSYVGTSSPLIKIYIYSDFRPYEDLTNVWLKLGVPFSTAQLNAKWSYYDNCHEGELEATSEYLIGSDNNYTYFFIQLLESYYEPFRRYMLSFEPSNYMDFEGYTKPLQIEIVSGPYDSYVLYASNYQIMHFYGYSEANTSFVISLNSNDVACSIINSVCQTRINVQLTRSLVHRMIIKLTGDYDLADDIGLKCKIQRDDNMTQLGGTNYNCYRDKLFSDDAKYLTFISEAGFFRGIYTITLSLQTPLYGGTNSLQFYTMDRHGSKILDIAALESISSTKPLNWAPGYPFLEFSFGFSATSNDTPLGIALFNMSTSYNQVYNTVMFTIMTDDLPEDLSRPIFSLELYIGSVNILVPIGSVYDNFDHADPLRKQISLSDDHLKIDNINFFNGKIYQVSFKIGFLRAMILDSSEEKGFGVMKLIHGHRIVVTGRTTIDNRYYKVLENRNLLLPESVDTAQDGYYRGYSAFRSEYSSALGTAINNYEVARDRNGLRYGDFQEFFFQSSVGPNSLYFNGALSSNQDGNLAFIEIITHRSISSKVSNFEDRFATKNCKLFSSVFNKWSDQLTIADAQVIVDDTNTRLITVEPPNYNPIGGCSYKQIITKSGFRYSRFRLRLKDLPFTDQLGVAGVISGIKLIFPSDEHLDDTNVQRGGFFIFNNVDVTEMPSEFYSGPNDSTILDAFVRVYFFSNMINIDDEIITAPSISMMDNMYVNTRLADSAFKSSGAVFSPQNVYYEDTGTSISLNNNELFPYTMHLHGQLDNLPVDTYAIKLQLNFIEPLVKDESTGMVDCSSKGIKVIRCYIDEGPSHLLRVTTQTVTFTLENIVAYNPKVITSLVLILDQQSLIPNADFSIVFPYKLVVNDNLYTTITDNTGIIYAFPSIILLDSTYRQLQRIDYGASGEHYNLFSYNPIYDMASLPYLTNVEVSTLDDGVAGNEPPKAAYVDHNGARIGEALDTQFSTICDTCVGYSIDNQAFSSTTFCTSYKFYNNEEFNADPSNTDAITMCHTFSYEINDRFCIYCPDVLTGNQNFALNNFSTSNLNGLLWPEDTIALISTQVPLSLTSFEYLNALMIPNQITLVTKNIELDQGQLSIQLSITLSFSNPLSSGNYIYLEKESGDFLLRINGEVNDYMCKILVNNQISACELSMNLTQIVIGLKSEVPVNEDVVIMLFGISTETMNNPEYCQLRAYSALDNSGNVNANLDSSDTEYLTLTYLEATSPGTITLSNLKMAPDIPLALTSLSFKVSIGNREILETDELIVDFGHDIAEQNLEIVLQEPITMKTITSVKYIELIGSTAVRIRLTEDFNYKEFFIAVSSLIAPIVPFPGIEVTYTFNEGYIAFKSNMVYYYISDPIDTQISTFKLLLNGHGFYNTFEISLTPRITIDRTDIIYIKFKGRLMPGISPILWAFEDNYEFNVLKHWIEDPYTLALTGWLNTLDGNRLFSFWISGISFDEINFADIFIANETGITAIKEVFRIYPNTITESFDVRALYLYDYILSNKVIRAFSDATLLVQTPVSLSTSQYVFLVFDQLSDEVNKTFISRCSLQTSQTKEALSEGTILPISECRIEGNTISFQIFANTSNYLLISVTNIPTPDHKYCSNNAPRVYITNNTKNKILLANPIILDNYDSSQLSIKDDHILLDYKNLENGVIEVPRGFYTSFEVHPVSENEDPLFYQNEINFVLINNLDSTFSLSTLSYLSVNSLTSMVGHRTTKLALGVSETAVVSTYLLPVEKQEVGDVMYANLPLLKVKVASKQLKLEIDEAVKVFKGSSSLPVLLIPEFAPYEEYAFKIVILNDPKGYLAIKDGIEDFSIAPNKPAYKLVINSSRSTDILNAKLLITPVDSSNTAPFVTSTVNLSIVPVPQTTSQDLIISLRETEAYNTMIDFTLDSEVYVVFYASPSYDHTELTFNYVENMVLRGIRHVGDMHFRAGVIYDYRQPLTFALDGLLASTEYKLTAYYQFPYETSIKKKEIAFETQSIDVVDGKLKLYFKTIIFLGRKIDYICRIAKQFSIAYENIWSADGLNCDSNLIAKYKYERLNGLESWFNITLSEMRLKNLENPNRDMGFNRAEEEENIIESLVNEVPHLKYMELQISTALREDQSKTIYSDIFYATRARRVISNWDNILNENNLISNLDALTQTFYKDPPVILNLNSIVPEVTVTSIRLSNLEIQGKGQLLAVIGDQTDNYVPTKFELMRVIGFPQYLYELLDTNSTKYDIIFEGLASGRKYTIYIATMDENNKPNSRMSEIKLISATTSSNEESSSRRLRAYLVMLTIMFISYNK